MSLELRALTAGYRQRPIWRDLRLPPIPPGALVAVVGPNAVGKSTLLKSLAGLLPASGQVRFQGEDLLRLRPTERLARLGFLPQSLPQAIPLVAYETVYSACRAAQPGRHRAAIEAAIDTVFATLGIGSLALRRLSEMSGGQRQMIGLAQVLVRTPPLMLLDEPTSALDLRWQLNVLEAVRRATRDSGAIALVASHDLNLALRYCDRLLVLAPGGEAVLGAPDTVLSPALLARAYGIAARVERCSRGQPIVLADHPLASQQPLTPHQPLTAHQPLTTHPHPETTPCR